MTRLVPQQVVLLAAGVTLMTATILPVPPVFGSGIARRDAVWSEDQHRQEAIRLAKDAVAHGTQGHADALVTNADAALQHVMKVGKDGHVEAGIMELKQAIEHGKAGHADVASKYAEQAIAHLSAK